MNCATAFERYLSLDKDESIPLSITLHLFHCPACRTCVRQLSKAERVVAEPLSVLTAQVPSWDAGPMDPVVAAAMARIRSSGLTVETERAGNHQVSLSRWLIAGMALAGGFIAFPFSPLGQWSRVAYGNAFSVPFYVLCGVAVTVYCGVFVGTNIDFFVKKFGIDRPAP